DTAPGPVQRSLKAQSSKKNATDGVDWCLPAEHSTPTLEKRTMTDVRMKKPAAICAAVTLVLTGGLAQSREAAQGGRGPHHSDDDGGCETGDGPLGGVNLAGADFGGDNLPSTYGDHYIYPSHADVDLFLSRQVRVFRVPFLWERLQRAPYGKFDAEEFARLDGLVRYITAHGATVVLDPHNYARYGGQVVGVDVKASALADLWSRLARVYR